jgi:hypothetical protein
MKHTESTGISHRLLAMAGVFRWSHAARAGTGGV